MANSAPGSDAASSSPRALGWIGLVFGAVGAASAAAALAGVLPQPAHLWSAAGALVGLVGCGICFVIMWRGIDTSWRAFVGLMLGSLGAIGAGLHAVSRMLGG